LYVGCGYLRHTMRTSGATVGVGLLTNPLAAQDGWAVQEEAVGLLHQHVRLQTSNPPGDSNAFRRKSARTYGPLPLVLTPEIATAKHDAAVGVQIAVLGPAVQIFYEAVRDGAGR
jgi:hypothetical protein